MKTFKKFLTRQEVRKMTGFSLVFIDRHFPRLKVGGKVLIPADALDNILVVGNPLFRGEAAPFAMGTMFQFDQGSSHSFGSANWHEFGQYLVTAFEVHLIKTGLYTTITKLNDVVEWMKSADGQAFFDKNITGEARQRRFAVYE